MARIPEAVPSRPGRAAPACRHSLRSKQSLSPNQPLRSGGRCPFEAWLHPPCSLGGEMELGRRHTRETGSVEVSCRAGHLPWHSPFGRMLRFYKICTAAAAVTVTAFAAKPLAGMQLSYPVSGVVLALASRASPSHKHRKALLRAKPAERRRRRATGLRCIHMHHASRAASVGTSPRSPFAGGLLFHSSER